MKRPRIGPEDETWQGADPLVRELERLKAITYWNRIKANILTVLLVWLMWEVYDIWPDQDFDPEHVETFRLFIAENGQVAIAFIGLLGVIFTNLMQTFWRRKK